MTDETNQKTADVGPSALSDVLGGSLTIGKTYEVRFPFVREKVSLFDGEACYEKDTWRPGVRSVPVYQDSCEDIADACGEMLLHVVDIHRPARYPTRVFFTRKWRDPEGKEFGKPGLRIMTEQAFKRRLRGYMHEYKTPNAS